MTTSIRHSRRLPSRIGQITLLTLSVILLSPLIVTLLARRLIASSTTRGLVRFSDKLDDARLSTWRVALKRSGASELCAEKQTQPAVIHVDFVAKRRQESVGS